ncbi:carbonic anhydrase [Chitinophagaceae bacterium LB-8]|uniref:Carbonic anhydrase n=1 Tax=Paraflavisolibacter caeni TaxID=2982496 RepID=A0A9X2XP85_9BACT|nr:carbonic anhydrase [Paraflavisolibacter caeni]MCU7550678.1 carbonic anhydrase [Paraflavisolibacter caeni]
MNRRSSFAGYKFSFFLVAGLFLFGCKNETQPIKTNATPLEKLLSGNQRFASFHPVHPDETARRMKEISTAQHPFAVIVCCSDSRVPPELLFDQGLGDVFVIRTAGNVISGLEMGSIEYAVEHLGVNLVMVLGHEKCGAVKAFVDGGEAPGHIKDIVDSIKDELEIKTVAKDDKNRLDDCVKANVLHGVHQLETQSEILIEKEHKHELMIVGARYDLDEGRVSLISHL